MFYRKRARKNSLFFNNPLFSAEAEAEAGVLPEASAEDKAPNDIKFKGVEDECLYRALTLTLREPKMKLDMGISGADMDGNNYQRLLMTLPSVCGIIQKTCKRGMFTFELGPKGNLHYHCYVKIKSNRILEYRNSLFIWNSRFGFVDDKPSRTKKARDIWKRYIQKEWQETQRFFFGRIRLRSPIGNKRFGKFLEWTKEHEEEHSRRHEGYESIHYTPTSEELERANERAKGRVVTRPERNPNIIIEGETTDVDNETCNARHSRRSTESSILVIKFTPSMIDTIKKLNLNIPEYLLESD